MIPQVEELARKLDALTPNEEIAALTKHVMTRSRSQEICDIEVEGERLRFDVDSLNAYLDAHPAEFPIGAFALDDETVAHVFSERFVDFDRAASLAFALNSEELLLQPTTMVVHGGENMLIDGANRVAVLAAMEMPAVRARVAPEAVWRRFLLPIEGEDVPPFSPR